MTTRFRASNTVLMGIWFASKHCDPRNETIDWAGIADEMDKIVPTENEKKLVEIANEMWNGTGDFVNVFGRLDKTNRQNLVNGIKLLWRII